MTKDKLLELAKACDTETRNMSKQQLFEALRKYVSAPSKEVIDTVADPQLLTPPKLSPQTLVEDVEQDNNFVDALASIVQEDWKYKLELETMKMNTQREQMQQRERDCEEREMHMQMQKKQMQMQMQMESEERESKLAQLQLQQNVPSDGNANNSNLNQSFQIDTAANMLPKLTTEHDIETYFIMFEKTARMNSWPEDKWAAILQTQLKGKGLKVLTDCQDFTKLKKSLLTAYELCPEVYRQSS